MPSTRKQKAKERRSRQLDMLSDVENVDIMLESYSRDEEENIASENEVIWTLDQVGLSKILMYKERTEKKTE